MANKSASAARMVPTTPPSTTPLHGLTTKTRTWASRGTGTTRTRACFTRATRPGGRRRARHHHRHRLRRQARQEGRRLPVRRTPTSILIVHSINATTRCPVASAANCSERERRALSKTHGEPGWLRSDGRTDGRTDGRRAKDLLIANAEGSPTRDAWNVRRNASRRSTCRANPIPWVRALRPLRRPNPLRTRRRRRYHPMSRIRRPSRRPRLWYTALKRCRII